MGNQAVKPRRRWWLLGVGALAIAATTSIGWKAADFQRSPRAAATRAWHGKVGKIARSGADKAAAGLFAEIQGGARFALAEGAEVGAGMRLITDARTRARVDFDDGSSVALERASDVALESAPRTMRVKEGAIVADVLAIEGAPDCTLLTEVGHVAFAGAKLLLTATDGRAAIEVLRGQANAFDTSGASARVEAGQEGTIGKGMRPEVVPANDLAQRVAFGEALSHNEDTDAPVSGLGELRARRPGSKDEKDHAVRLARHDVKVRIVGSVAKTEIDETFANDTDAELEGVYRFPLPPGAQIERLALEVDGKLLDGSFVERDKAAKIWRGVIQNATPVAARPKEEIIWVPGPWRDPALLEWQRGGRAELKIFPIPKRGARRIVLSYTETVAPVAGTRRYVYPLPQGTSSDLVIDKANIDVQVMGADPAVPVRARGYELTSTGGEKTTRFNATMNAFAPSGDLTIEYALGDKNTDATAWAYSDGKAKEDAYVAIALRPKLPKWSDVKPRDQVIVIDAGRAMFGERFKRARRLAVQLTQEMDRRDRVTVLVCDLGCKRMSGGWKSPGGGAAHDVDAFLAPHAPDGASDLVGAVREAAKLDRDAQRDLRVVLVSAGMATAGYRTPDRMASEVAAALPDGRAQVVTVPVGIDADVDALGAVARGGGGVIVPYQPGERLETAALEVLNATYGVTLRDVKLTLPDGLREVAPRVISPIRAGSETIIVARMSGERAQGDVQLNGTVGGEAFEAKYPIQIAATSDEGNAFVPRLYAAARISDRERDGGDASKAELVALSQKYSVPTKFTSLLVLESEAMFTAFGIDRSARGATWSGESAATGTEVASLSNEKDKSAHGESGRSESEERPASAADIMPDSPNDFRGGGAGPATKSAPLATATARPVAPPQPAPTMALPDARPGFSDDPVFRDRDDIPRRSPPRRPGRWMKREFFRVASIAATDRTVVATDKISAARAALLAAPDERKRHMELAKLLARSGDVQELAEVVAKWAQRDPLDADANAARADLAAREGRRDEALRALAGISASREAMNDPSALASIAVAHERAGLLTEACAFRLAAAELRPSDPDTVAHAFVCERTASRIPSAARFMELQKDEKARNALTSAVSKLESKSKAEGVGFGDVIVDATWDSGANADLDLAVFDPSGNRISWAARGKGFRAADCTSRTHEALSVSNFSAGTFTVEVVRADRGTIPVSGKLRITSLGTVQIVPFTLTQSRAQVARVDVRLDSRMVPAAGPGF